MPFDLYLNNLLILKTLFCLIYLSNSVFFCVCTKAKKQVWHPFFYIKCPFFKSFYSLFFIHDLLIFWTVFHICAYLHDFYIKRWCPIFYKVKIPFWHMSFFLKSGFLENQNKNSSETVIELADCSMNYVRTVKIWHNENILTAVTFHKYIGLMLCYINIYY